MPRTITPCSLVHLSLFGVGLALCAATPARASSPSDVHIQAILEVGDAAPLVSGVHRVHLDDGQLAIEYITAEPEYALAIGLFGAGIDAPRVVDNQMQAPGFDEPFSQIELGGFSQGRLF